MLAITNHQLKQHDTDNLYKFNDGTRMDTTGSGMNSSMVIIPGSIISF